MKSFFDQVYSSLAQGKFGEAENFIQTFQPASKSERRMLGHAKAKVLLFRDDSQSALKCLEQTLSDEGPHVGLMLDLACCYYNLNAFANWRIVMDQVATEMAQLQGHLEPENFRKAALLFHKFREEIGYIHEAKEFYLRSYKEQTLPGRKIANLSQLLRIEAQYGATENIQLYYTTLKQLRDSGTDQDIDVTHALVLAEAEIFEPSMAVESYLEFCRQVHLRVLTERDKNLLLFDLCEIFLRKNIEVPLSLLSQIKVARCESLFEIYLRQIALNEPIEESYERLFQKMPLGQALRLTALILARHSELQTEATKIRIEFIIKSLSKKNINVWLGYFSWQAPERKFATWSLDRKIAVNETLIDFGSLRSLWEFLFLFERKPEHSFDEISQTLWHSDCEDSQYHRIRRNVQRINAHAYSQGMLTLLKVDGRKVVRNF